MDGRRWTAAIAASAVALCCLTLAYLGSSRALAAQRTTAGQRTLQVVLSHRPALMVLLKEEPLERLAIDPSMSTLGEDRLALQTYRLKIDRALAGLSHDQNALERRREDLRLPGWLGLARPPGLDRESRRLTLASDGLESARSALTIKRRQSLLVETTLDGVGTLLQMSPDLERADWDGAQDLYARAQLDIVAAAGLAAAPDVPPAVRDFVASLEPSLDHVHALVEAAASRNLPAVDRLAGVVDEDGQALAGFDPEPAEAWSAARLEPLITAYQAGLRAAG